MKLTVVTPLYNREDLIEETIKSVLDQDFEDFEYLIIDDGSTDNGKDVVSKFLSDKRVKYIYKKNGGEADTVNMGWNLAKGEYFTQVNSDDPILPGLFSEMVKALDSREDVVVAFPDFNFIDIKGKVISVTRSPEWDFLDALSNYSCYASSPGAFIRRSTFKKWDKIRDKRFKHISDNYMYFHMALEGQFLHIPKVLATWRQHSAGISSRRYESIPEIEIFFKEFFSKKDLPKEVKNCKWKTRRAMYHYFIRLLEDSDLKDKDKRILGYKNALESAYMFKNLQVGDNDLIGNKFNGHDLHKYLIERNIDSSHLVWDKHSDDPNTYIISGHRSDRSEIKNYSDKIQQDFYLDNRISPIAYDILYNPLFLNADIVHLHLIHNLSFDLNLLPVMTRLKPIIWTVHDPWVLSGHCIVHFDCQKWQTGCGDCPLLNAYYVMNKDNTALNFIMKKTAIQNSHFDIIVASKFMERLLKKSQFFTHTRIHHIPFGIDLNIFKPRNKTELRQKYGIPDAAIVLLFRSDNTEKKGLGYIEYLISKINTKKEIYIASLGGVWGNKTLNFPYREFGWISDDNILSEIYNLADIFLMPSEFESFGMMAIEAMACGVLPIVIDGTALPETVNAPKIGISTPRDKNKYFEAVSYYIENDKAREEKGNKCSNYAKEFYGIERYLNDVTEVYQQAMKAHKIDPEYESLLEQLLKYQQVSLVKELTPGISTQNYNPNSLKSRINDKIKGIINLIPHFRRINLIRGKIDKMNLKLDILKDRLTTVIIDQEKGKVHKKK